ncbi:MAG: type II toxin-antitoxin system VapC family toxin [Hydrococcus sp. SU_1_0]|nr:type II toxin-antitoxin system VapC family toxin [Hydrococcus sp. SU_1_0]
MQIKIQLGKLDLDIALSELIQKQQEVNNLNLLPIEVNHIYALSNMANHHKDPFDRLIIAQSIVENIDLLSVDQVFDRYFSQSYLVTEFLADGDHSTQIVVQCDRKSTKAITRSHRTVNYY